MNTDDVAGIIARIVVGGCALWVVSKLFGPKAGVVGSVVVLAAHETLDAPVAKQVRQLLGPST